MLSVKSQYLTLPIENCGIEAGFKNQEYYQYHKFNHLGWDLNDYVKRAQAVPLYSSGIGEVIAQGFDTGLGYCIVVKYYNAYYSKTKQFRDVICRYMHLSSISVKKGDKLYHGTLLGKVGNTGTSAGNGIHLHIEFDLNLITPQLSGQVAWKNITNRVINGGDGSTMVDPKYFLNATPYMSLKAWDNSMVSTKTDYEVPMKYIHDLVVLGTNSTSDTNTNTTITIPSSGSQTNTTTTPNVTVTSPSQKLIFPVNAPYITASASLGVFTPVNSSLLASDPYYKRFKFAHYGIDLYNIGNLGSLMYCEGNGTVLEVGKDTCFGNVVIIKYENAYNHKTKKCQDIVIRHFHLANIKVKKGQKVTIDTPMGNYGNTGTYSAGIHLHMECDTDTKNYQYTAGLKTSQNIIKAGNASTMFNPFEILHLKRTAPENQYLSYDKSSYGGKPYVHLEDINMVPKIEK